MINELAGRAQPTNVIHQIAPLQRPFESVAQPSTLGHEMMMTELLNQHRASDPEIFGAIEQEGRRQLDAVEMIPSENYTYPEVLAALGSVFTNKYAEGYPGRRYYGGQQNTDAVENIARERACALFRAEHANVQPLSGSPMNQAVYFGLLRPGDTILAMDLSHGGHLTHGAPVSHMSKVFNFVRYKTRTDDRGSIDFEEMRAIAESTRPKMVLCGHSSYPRDLDYAAFRLVADSVGAFAVADVSHIAGLIAAGLLANPFDFGFDVVTTTTHKSLRGPRAGLILSKRHYAKVIDAAVFPGLQGGPHMNVVAAAAIAFKKAAGPDFTAYARQVLANAATLAAVLIQNGCNLVTDGTTNHLVVVDTMKSSGMDGAEAEKALDEIGITVNKQLVPDDTRPPLHPSGIRLGTPACTTRGMREAEMMQIGNAIARVVRRDVADKASLREELRELARAHPII